MAVHGTCCAPPGDVATHQLPALVHSTFILIESYFLLQHTEPEIYICHHPGSLSTFPPTAPHSHVLPSEYFKAPTQRNGCWVCMRARQHPACLTSCPTRCMDRNICFHREARRSFALLKQTQTEVNKQLSADSCSSHVGILFSNQTHNLSLSGRVVKCSFLSA